MYEEEFIVANPSASDKGLRCPHCSERITLKMLCKPSASSDDLFGMLCPHCRTYLALTRPARIGLILCFMLVGILVCLGLGIMITVFPIDQNFQPWLFFLVVSFSMILLFFLYFYLFLRTRYLVVAKRPGIFRRVIFLLLLCIALVVLVPVSMIAGETTGIQIVNSRYEDVYEELMEPNGDYEVFSEESLEGLPEVAGRFFLHAIKPGTKIASSVSLLGSGEILDANGLSWTEQGSISSSSGYAFKSLYKETDDSTISYYIDGKYRRHIIRYQFLGNDTYSGKRWDERAADLYARMALMYLPSAMTPQAGVSWEQIDSEHAEVVFTTGDYKATLTVTINAEGQLEEIFGKQLNYSSDTKLWGYIPYRIRCEAEKTYKGYTIPSRYYLDLMPDNASYTENLVSSIAMAYFVTEP